MPPGQFEPLYKTTLNVQDGELPILSLSVYGAVAMAHNEVSEQRHASSFDEGQFSVFRYTSAAGREVLAQIRAGAVIRSAKLLEGQDRLELPNES
ncbi:hypothetical protein REPUB_Repub11eG0069100 [Reevesia pubescens]